MLFLACEWKCRQIVVTSLRSHRRTSTGEVSLWLRSRVACVFEPSQSEGEHCQSSRIRRLVKHNSLDNERCLKKDDFASVGETAYSSGAHVEYELNGTWVDDSALHTEDGRMQVELGYNLTRGIGECPSSRRSPR